jgi:hypothetical protein
MPDLSSIPRGALSTGGTQTSPTWISWFNSVYRAIRSSPAVSSGVAAPTTTPLTVGDIFVDTTANKIYVATGVASSGDWTIVN